MRRRKVVCSPRPSTTPRSKIRTASIPELTDRFSMYQSVFFSVLIQESLLLSFIITNFKFYFMHLVGPFLNAKLQFG